MIPEAVLKIASSHLFSGLKFFFVKVKDLLCRSRVSFPLLLGYKGRFPTQWGKMKIIAQYVYSVLLRAFPSLVLLH